MVFYKIFTENFMIKRIGIDANPRGENPMWGVGELS